MKNASRGLTATWYNYAYILLYCPHCDLLITHQDIIERFLEAIFSERSPEMVGNSYLVVGTLEKATWKRGIQNPLMTEEIFEALHDFREVVIFKLVGGWGPAK